MASRCSECGICCSLFLVNLSEEEYKSKRFRAQFAGFGLTSDFIEAEMCGHNILEQKKDGSCVYLKDGKCSIHESRPKVCRAFFCTSKDKVFKKMIDNINKKKNAQLKP